VTSQSPVGVTPSSPGPGMVITTTTPDGAVHLYNSAV
jgi:hypothetical protein